MRKISAIFFLSIYLMSATEISQLLKVPQLLEHFREHRAEDKGVSLLEFFRIHYGQPPVRDADYEKDMKLPFKTDNNIVSSITTAYFPVVTGFSFLQPLEFPEKKSFNHKEEFLLSSFLSCIWQPPKSC